MTSGLQVTSKRTKLYSAFWRDNFRNHFNISMVLAAPLQHGAESTRAFGLPSVTNDGLVATGTDGYNILQRVGDHCSPLIPIATDVGSLWEESEFRIQSFFWIFKFLVKDFGSGFSCLVPANTNTLILRRIKQTKPSAGRNSNLPCDTRGKIGHQINRCVIFGRQFLINHQLIFKLMR